MGNPSNSQRNNSRFPCFFPEKQKLARYLPDFLKSDLGQAVEKSPKSALRSGFPQARFLEIGEAYDGVGSGDSWVKSNESILLMPLIHQKATLPLKFGIHRIPSFRAVFTTFFEILRASLARSEPILPPIPRFHCISEL